MSYYGKKVKKCDVCGDEASIVKYVNKKYNFAWLCPDHIKNTSIKEYERNNNE